MEIFLFEPFFKRKATILYHALFELRGTPANPLLDKEFLAYKECKNGVL